MYTTRELCWKQKMDGVYILKKIKEEFKAINKRVMAGISLGVSVIDIGLSGTLELWTSQCPVWLLCILAVLATLGAFVTIYSYMNEKEDTFIEQSGFSREEIEYGIRCVMNMYGFDA